MFKLLLGGTYVGYALGGAPPRPLRPPQGSLGVTEFWKKLKKSQKLYKKFTRIKIPQIIALTSILGHLGILGGRPGLKILKLPCRGVI